MFPRDLLAVKRRGAAIRPDFAPLDAEHLDLARNLIALHEAHVGRRRGALADAVRETENAWGTRYKVVRGLATLLDRAATWEVAARVDPATARRVVWSTSARVVRGAATTPDARARVLDAAARDLDIAAADVEQALVADAEENLVLVHFDAPRPEWLLRRFNLGLAQTLLFDCVRLEVEIASGFRVFLGLVKLNGLMHVVTVNEDGSHRVVIDGPVSLFKDTRRYGTAMAKVLPGLARCAPWTLTATIQDKDGGNRERTFRTADDEMPIPRRTPGDADAGAFDSSVEARFARAWASLRSAWRAEREPAALQTTDGELLIPDFGFAWRDGPVTAYLEIVGYWTPEYLARKKKKLAALREDAALLIAVDDALAVGEDAFADARGDVLFFKGDVPLVPVVQWLKTQEKALVADDAERVRALGVPRDADVVTLDALAEAAGVTRAAVEQALPTLDLADRVRVGNSLVRPSVLKAVAAEIADGLTVAEVDAVARAAGLDDSASLLDHLAYAVEWKGLDPADAVIRKRGA